MGGYSSPTLLVAVYRFQGSAEQNGHLLLGLI
jgi:hypothetical protein